MMGIAFILPSLTSANRCMSYHRYRGLQTVKSDREVAAVSLRRPGYDNTALSLPSPLFRIVTNGQSVCNTLLLHS